MKNILMLSALLFGGATLTHASVTYFYQVNGGSNTFQYTAPTFLTGPVDVAIVVPAASMDFCTTSTSCTEVDFYPSGRTADDPAHQPEFIIGDSSFGLCCKVFVPFGSFGTPGNYLASNSSPSNPPSDTWTVTDNSAAGVPEPATVCLLGAGLLALAARVYKSSKR